MAVAVDDNNVFIGDGRMPYDLIGSRCTVGHKEAVVGPKDARSVAFGCCNGSSVVEQLTKLLDRVAHVGSKHVLAEELMEHLADRTLEKRHPAGVSGAMPRIRPILSVVNHRAEKGRRQSFDLSLRFPENVPCDKLWSILEHVDKAVELSEDVVGNMSRCTGFAV